MSFLRAEAIYRLQDSLLMKLSYTIKWEEVGKVLGDLGRSDMTTIKIQTQMTLKAIAFNLLKAIRQEQFA